MAFGVPMFFALKDNEDKDVLANVIYLIKYCVIWCIGYVGMWAGKWIIATVILNENIILDALNELAFRASNIYVRKDDKSIVTLTAFKTIIAILSNYSNIIYLILIALFLVYMEIYRKKLSNRIFCSLNVPYFILMLIPFIWYGVFKNHSYVHLYFTYRSLIVSWLSGTYILTRKLSVKK
jgi:hypothetical protein